MTKSYRYAICAVVVFSLSACATTADQQAKIDQTVAIACAGLDSADALFNALAKQQGTKITAEQVEIEAKVFAGVKALCVPPYTTDPANLIKKATDAATAIIAMTK